RNGISTWTRRIPPRNRTEALQAALPAFAGKARKDSARILYSTKENQLFSKISSPFKNPKKQPEDITWNHNPRYKHPDPPALALSPPPTVTSRQKKVTFDFSSSPKPVNGAPVDQKDGQTGVK